MGRKIHKYQKGYRLLLAKSCEIRMQISEYQNPFVWGTVDLQKPYLFGVFTSEFKITLC